jgi:hypothetical protein
MIRLFDHERLNVYQEALRLHEEPSAYGDEAGHGEKE